MPPIMQARLSLCAEPLEPAVGCRSTDAHSCATGGFLPGRSFLHQNHHLLFGRLVLLTFHNAFLFHSLSLLLSTLSGLHVTARFCTPAEALVCTTGSSIIARRKPAQRTTDLAMRISGLPSPLASGMTPTIT